MANASRDDNNIPTLIGVLDSDGDTIVKVKANPSTNALKVEDGVLGDNNGPTEAMHDDNNIPTLLAVSSADGVTPVPIYVDSDGNLLVDSN